MALEGIHRWVCCRSGFVFGINQSNSFFPPRFISWSSMCSCVSCFCIVKSFACMVRLLIDLCSGRVGETWPSQELSR